MTMPHIALHLIPEEADLEDLQVFDAGSPAIHFIRFAEGMASGKTAITIGIPVSVKAIKDGAVADDAIVIAQTSLEVLRMTMAGLEGAEQRDADLAQPDPIEDAEERNHGRTHP